MYDRTKHAKLFLLGFAIVIVILGGLTLWHALSFHVISTEPSVGKVSTVSPFFKINFSQQLSSSGFKVTASPSGFAGKATISGKVITVPFSTTLTSGKAYTITVVSVASTSGKKITNAVFTFEPTYIPSSELSKDQQEALLKLENVSGPSQNDPIVRYLPYQTTDFTLSSVTTPTKNPPKKFPLLAVITPSEADMGDESAAVAQYKQEVLTYITSLGLNPANYTITYTVQTP